MAWRLVALVAWGVADQTLEPHDRSEGEREGERLVCSAPRLDERDKHSRGRFRDCRAGCANEDLE